MHQNYDLQKDWIRYGADNFIYEILEEIKETDDKRLDYEKEVIALEEMIIEELQPYENKGYHTK